MILDCVSCYGVVVLLAVIGPIHGHYPEDVSGHLTIQKVGHWPVSYRDVTLVLYANILNKGMQMTHASVTVTKCCLVVAKEMDCQSMGLIGGYHGDIQPMELKQLIFVFPTLYPYDREGECELHLTGDRPDSYPVRFNISFNSHIHKSTWISWLPVWVQAFLFGTVAEDCEGIDDDRLQHCVPVNCLLKYGGQKNFFDPKKRQCVHVPVCSLETEVYDLANNLCIKTPRLPNIEKVNIELNGPTYHSTDATDVEEQWRTLIRPRLDCGRHGHLTDDHSTCVCDPHWTSVEETEQAVIMMCNVEVVKAINMYPILIFVFSVFLLLLFLTICLYVRSRTEKRRLYKGGTPLKGGSSCFEELHKYWKPTSDTSSKDGELMAVNTENLLASVELDDSQDEF